MSLHRILLHLRGVAPGSLPPRRRSPPHRSLSPRRRSSPHRRSLYDDSPPKPYDPNDPDGFFRKDIERILGSPESPEKSRKSRKSRN